MHVRDLAEAERHGIFSAPARKLAEKFADAPLDTPVHMWDKPEDLVIIVTGGAGKHSQYVPTFGNTRSISKMLRRQDGEMVQSVEELKRG